MDDEQYRTKRSGGLVSAGAAALNYQPSTIDRELSHPNRNTHGLESRLNHRKQTTRDRSNRNKFRGAPNNLLLADGLSLPRALLADDAASTRSEKSPYSHSLFRGTRIAPLAAEASAKAANRNSPRFRFRLTFREHKVLTFSNRRKTALSAFTLEGAAIEYGAHQFEPKPRARRIT